MIYLITGWPGAGKSTVAVQHAIFRYASAGRRVAANFPMDFAPVSPIRGSHLSRAVVEVIPDRPTAQDLGDIGYGGESEEKAGMLIIDEAGGWLNARSWQGKDREEIINWLTQSRKRYWDVYLIAQAPAMLDKQVREAVCELVVRIRRLDRFKLAGVPMPRLHIAIVRYGLEHNGPVVERWFYRGGDAHKAFQSYRVFGADATRYSVLPATLTRWRYIPEAVPVRGAKAVSVVWWLLALLLLKFSIGLASAALLVGWGMVRLWWTESLLPAERLKGRRLPKLRAVALSVRAGVSPVGKSRPTGQGTYPRDGTGTVAPDVRRGPQMLPMVHAVRLAFRPGRASGRAGGLSL